MKTLAVNVKHIARICGDGIRFNLSSVQYTERDTPTDHVVRLSASDGKRALIFSRSEDSQDSSLTQPEDLSVLIPGERFKDAFSQIKNGREAECRLFRPTPKGGLEFSVHVPRSGLRQALEIPDEIANGNFPNLQNLVPHDPPTASVSVNAFFLSELLEVIAKLSVDKPGAWKHCVISLELHGYRRPLVVSVAPGEFQPEFKGRDERVQITGCLMPVHPGIYSSGHPPTVIEEGLTLLEESAIRLKNLGATKAQLQSLLDGVYL